MTKTKHEMQMCISLCNCSQARFDIALLGRLSKVDRNMTNGQFASDSDSSNGEGESTGNSSNLTAFRMLEMVRSRSGDFPTHLFCFFRVSYNSIRRSFSRENGIGYKS